MAVSPGRLNQRGVALITALLVVAVATIAAAAMASRQQLEIRRTGNVLNADQAWAYAEGVEDWARVILQDDAKDSQTDHLNEAWATQLAPIQVEGGQIVGHLEDLQGRYNLNNLLDKGKVSAPDLAYFQRLLSELDLNPELADALLDWMDRDQDTRFPGGAEDGIYLSLQPPYRTANRSLVSPSELAAVKGFDADALTKLRPLVTALPARTALNVNTAAAPLIRALQQELSEADAEALVGARGDSGYETTDEFLAQEVLAGREVQLALSVNSDYFLLQAQVDIGTARSQLFSVLQRDGENLTTLSRSRGTW